MTEEKSKQKTKRGGYPDRVTLSSECLSILSSWKKRVEAELKGGVVTRASLLEWLVKARGVELSKSDVVELVRLHEDPVKSLEWVLGRVKAASKAGESVDVALLLREIDLKPRRHLKKRRSDSN